MQIRVQDNPGAGRFEISVDGQVVGFADYTVREGVMTMPHTVVDPAYGGRGLGTELVRVTLEEARERGLRVRPLCSFVAAYIRKHPDYGDLVA